MFVRDRDGSVTTQRWVAIVSNRSEKVGKHCPRCICSYGDCLEVKREYYQNCFIYCQCATSSMDTVNKNSSYSPVGP